MPLSDTASNPLWINMAIFGVAGAFIWLSGSRLTRLLDGVAIRHRLDHAFVGMLLLGGITSLPEVANTLTASSIGKPALAINNLLGSAAINVLILAVADALVGRHAVTAITAKPSTMMMATLCMIVLVVIAFAITIGDVAIGPLGIAAIGIGALSIFSFWLAAGHDDRSPWAVDNEDEIADRALSDEPPDKSRTALWAGVALHGALIFFAGYALSQTGDGLAEQLGLTSAMVGFGLIGTATSLPELVTIITALKLNRPEMAFGQVLGTNFVNLSLIPLGDAVYRGEPVLNTLGTFEVLLALLGAGLIGIFMVGLLEHRDKTILKMGRDSAVVMVLFALGFAALASVDE